MQQKKPLSLWKTVVAVIFAGFLIVIFVPFFVGYEPPSTPGVRCITNLHNIALAMSMYKCDNKSYPETLGGYVQTDAKGKVVPFDQSKSKTSLYNEYIKSVREFHCPMSPNAETDAVVEITVDGKARRYYAYDSYDVYTPDWVDGMVRLGADALRYNPSLNSVKNPADDTVITWCSYHEKLGDPKSMVPVLFLDGHSDMISAAQVQGINGHGGSRWSTKPKE